MFLRSSFFIYWWLSFKTITAPKWSSLNRLSYCYVARNLFGSHGRIVVSSQSKFLSFLRSLFSTYISWYLSFFASDIQTLWLVLLCRFDWCVNDINNSLSHLKLNGSSSYYLPFLRRSFIFVVIQSFKLCRQTLAYSPMAPVGYACEPADASTGCKVQSQVGKRTDDDGLTVVLFYIVMTIFKRRGFNVSQSGSDKEDF